MTDSMNFGPEWLRNLSSDGSTSGGGVGASGGGGSRPQLADFRYGREEMLTLFTKGLRPPSSLTNYPMLYANTAQGQLPLALTPMTEDERGSLGGWTLGAVGGGSGTRGGIGGINTSAMTGRGGGGRSISMTGGGSRGGGMSATRGGSGRGGATGGGGGWQPTNHNGSSLDATEWSPRKEYMSGGGGGGSYRSQSLVTDNWRKGARIEGGMDGDGAITGLVPQGQGQEGWRQGQQIRPVDRSNPSPTTSVPSSDPPPQRWMQRSTSWRDDTSPSANNASANPPSRGPQQRRVWDEDSHTGHLHHQQQLPEWALEQVSEPGGGTVSAGSFDATGAFHGERDREREHREAAGGGLYKSTSQKDIGSGGNSRVGAPLATSRSALALGMKSGGDRTGQGSSVSQVSSGANVNKEHPPDASSDKRHSDDANVKEKGRPIVEENIMQQPQNIDKGNSVQQLINGCVNGVALSKREPFENSAINRDRVVDRGDEDFDRLQEDLVLKLVVDEEPSSNNGLGGRGANVGVGIVNHAQQPPPPPNLVPPSSEKWFYQDPQGDLQGPFMARDMADWYRAGYFSVALLVRRGCDERFFCLGDLVAGCQGGNPFQVSPLIQPPPLLLRDSRDQLQQQQQQQQQQHRVVEHREAPPAVVNGPSGPGPAPMLPDHPDLLQLQILQQQIAYRQHQQHQQQQQQQQYNNQQPPVVQANNHRSSIVEASPASWASLSALQQQELLAQQMLQQSQHSHQHVQHQQISAPPTNPLMHMISQIQQGVKGAAGLMDQQQVPVQAIPAPLQPPSQTSTQPLNPLETFLAQMGNLQQQTSVSQPPPVLHTDPTHPPPQSQTSSSTTTQSNPLLEMFRMKPSFPVHQQQQQVVQQSTTQLEQLAMWQKNHQYNSGSVMHLQHVQQQQQQWRAMQQQQQSQQQQQQQQSQVMQQEQSVGLWDVSTPSTQTAPIVSPQSTISSVINQQQLSHHSSPSPPLQQHQQQQQQIAPQTKVQQLQQQPSTTVPQGLVKSVVYNRTSIPLAQQVQEPVTTPGKKKQIAVTDGVTAEKKKEEEKLKKKEQSKKQDSEKKQAAIVVDEKQRKKEEEKAARIKEEKAKQRESDERKAKEHEQKRKAKEQRKIDEENRKKAEEQKRLDDIDRERQAARDRDEHLRRQQQTLEEAEQTPPQPQAKVLSPAPPAPWLSTPPVSSNHAPMLNTVSPSPTTNLADIQRAEREKRSAEQQQQQQMAAAAVVLYQQQQAQLMQLEREQQESKTFSWASKPLKVGKVKSLAAIQAEEHELLLKKQVEEQRLAAVKEKEAAAVPTAGIWSGQSLTWATENIASPNTGGFWDEAPRIQKQQQIGIQQVGSSKIVSSTNVQQLAKPTVTAGNVIIAKKSQQQSHLAGNRKDTNAGKNNNNNDSTDEFSNWCSKLLANINANVDVPTFIGFLRDIESAFDVREYCRDYLGDSGATQQFAAQFLEKRRLFKPNRSVAHKDDMCAPAPALTPNHHAGGVATVPVNVTAATASANVCYGSSLRETSGNGSSANVISTDFQEVKGKGKKVKKSKMLKVDSRILGFSVTAAPDRFNVGDRDYGDTT